MRRLDVAMYVKPIIWHIEVVNLCPGPWDLTHKERGPGNLQTIFILQIPAKTDPRSSISPCLLLESKNDETSAELLLYWSQDGEDTKRDEAQ